MKLILENIHKINCTFELRQCLKYWYCKRWVFVKRWKSDIRCLALLYWHISFAYSARKMEKYEGRIQLGVWPPYNTPPPPLNFQCPSHKRKETCFIYFYNTRTLLNDWYPHTLVINFPVTIAVRHTHHVVKFLFRKLLAHFG